MDQTPIQAEMPQETTLAKTGAKDAGIGTTGGEFSTVFPVYGFVIAPA